MSLCKIICFIKQIYENKSLSPNHVFTFEISRFTIFILLLIILWFFIRINNFLSKIGPIWAHKGSYGPIRALWARYVLRCPSECIDFPPVLVNWPGMSCNWMALSQSWVFKMSEYVVACANSPCLHIDLP